MQDLLFSGWLVDQKWLPGWRRRSAPGSSHQLLVQAWSDEEIRIPGLITNSWSWAWSDKEIGILGLNMNSWSGLWSLKKEVRLVQFEHISNYLATRRMHLLCIGIQDLEGSSEQAWYEASKKTLRWLIYGCAPWYQPFDDCAPRYQPQRPLTNIANISHEGSFDQPTSPVMLLCRPFMMTGPKASVKLLSPGCPWLS